MTTSKTEGVMFRVVMSMVAIGVTTMIGIQAWIFREIVDLKVSVARLSVIADKWHNENRDEQTTNMAFKNE